MLRAHPFTLIIALSLSLLSLCNATARSSEPTPGPNESPITTDPEVDRLAVLRCGDQVQHVTGIQQSPIDEFVEIMGSPPPDDAHKWFITVLTTTGCAPCAQLKKDWEQDPWLLALANPHNPKESWAHYNIYQAGDKSQDFRFKEIRVAGYPTILVQPPRNGHYGDPKTIVLQSTYNGDPQELASKITAAIRRYLQRQQPAAGIGQAPPFSPTPLPVNPIPDGWPNLPPPEKPTTPQAPANQLTTLGILSAGVSGAATMFMLSIAIPWVLRLIRQQRIAGGQQPLLNDDQFATLLKLLEQSNSAAKN